MTHRMQSHLKRAACYDNVNLLNPHGFPCLRAPVSILGIDPESQAMRCKVHGATLSAGNMSMAICAGIEPTVKRHESKEGLTKAQQRAVTSPAGRVICAAIYEILA